MLNDIASTQTREIGPGILGELNALREMRTTAAAVGNNNLRAMRRNSAKFFNRSIDTNRNKKYTSPTGRKVRHRETNNQQGARTMSDSGLWNICVEDVQFPGGFGDEVAALKTNKGMPIIVQELEDGYRLFDGWGRVSGLLNAGAEEVQAILVSDADIAERTVTGDDETWNAAMYARYAPQYTYPGTTN